MVLELQRTQGVRDPLDGVALAVGPVVQRLDTPGVAGALVVGVQDSVHHRVSQVQIW